MVGLVVKEKVYVTYTCKKCGRAFIDEDIDNNINEVPLKTRYCPACVAKGYTNDKLKKTLTKEQERNKIIKQKLKENNITDKKDVQFIKKYIRNQVKHKENTKQPVFINFIFKDALEVLSYQSWKNQ